MAELIAAGVSIVTAIAIVAAIFQVESHPASTTVLANDATSTVSTVTQQLFK